MLFRSMPHIDLRAELPARCRQKQASHRLGLTQRKSIYRSLQQNIAGPGQPVNGHLRQNAAQVPGYQILLWHGGYIGGRALQHHHMIRLVGHSRYQRHGSGATANNHHPFATVIVVCRPVLRMDHVTAELVDPRNLRRVTGVVLVISGAIEYKAGAELVLLIGCLVDGFDDPVFVFAMPAIGRASCRDRV